MPSRWLRASLGVLALLSVGFPEDASGAAGSVAYGYDPLGRLKTALYDNGVCVVYVYDANGNRTSQTISAASPGQPTWGSRTWGCFKWTAP
jgi:RHS Repeat